MDLPQPLPYLCSVDTGASTPQSWHCIKCTVPGARADDVSAICHDLGSCGLVHEDAAELTHLSAYFSTSYPPDDLLEDLSAELASFGLRPELRLVPVAVEDWSAQWRQYFRPIWATPRIVVHPSWIPVPTDPHQIAITIDPKMAFGTGGHESTRLCLQALGDAIAPGYGCLDLGAGSGVLSIAAVKLGAASVLALDIDPQAVDNATENLALNGISAGAVDLRCGSLEIAGGCEFDLVLANIQSVVLTPMLPALAACTAPGGTLIMSGLLGREEATFSRCVQDAGLRVERVIREGEWIALVARWTDAICPASG
jgi:ribosomal protein L11 methyltransferase